MPELQAEGLHLRRVHGRARPALVRYLRNVALRPLRSAVRKSPKSDPQRSEVYTWERKYIYATVGDMGTKEFYKILRDVCKKYGVPRPIAGTIPRTWKDFTAVCDTENNALWFAPKHCTAKVLLHELAHWIVHSYGLQGAPHGAVWLGLYLWLMDRYKVLPLDASIPSAQAAGLQFIEPRRATPSSLRDLEAAMSAQFHQGTCRRAPVARHPRQ